MKKVYTSPTLQKAAVSVAVVASALLMGIEPAMRK
jgi:hypothetical protein